MKHPSKALADGELSASTYFLLAVLGGAAAATGSILVDYLFFRRKREIQLLGTLQGELGSHYRVIGQVQTQLGGVADRVDQLAWRVGALERRAYSSAYRNSPYTSIAQPPTAYAPPAVVAAPPGVPAAPGPAWTEPEEVDAAVRRFQLIEYDD